MDNLTSQHIKAAIVAYYRFMRRMNLCCTEFSNGADVLCTSVGCGRVDEIEVKISWADFMRDFKKPKHELYLSGKPKDEGKYWERMTTPHYFWFAAPKELAMKIALYLAENGQMPYGVYSLEIKKDHIGLGEIMVLRPAKKLHKMQCDISDYDVAARMASDYAKLLLHHTNLELQKSKDIQQSLDNNKNK